MEKERKTKRRETLKTFKATLFHSSGKNSTCVLVFRLNRKTIFTRRRTVSLKRFLFTTLYTVRQKFHSGPVGRGKSTLWKQRFQFYVIGEIDYTSRVRADTTCSAPTAQPLSRNYCHEKNASCPTYKESPLRDFSYLLA